MSNPIRSRQRSSLLVAWRKVNSSSKHDYERHGPHTISVKRSEQIYLLLVTLDSIARIINIFCEIDFFVNIFKSKAFWLVVLLEDKNVPNSFKYYTGPTVKFELRKSKD